MDSSFCFRWYCFFCPVRFWPIAPARPPVRPADSKRGITVPGGAADVEIDATCRRVGSYSYLYMADDVTLSESQLDEFKDAFETGWSGKEAIYEGIGSRVGYAPDVNDFDQKVYILVHDFKNLIPGKVLSYFRPEDVTRNDPNGNDKEVLFVDTSTQTPLFDIGGELSEKHLSWLAYSLCEMTGYVSDPSEEAWVVDSICRAATYLAGHYVAVFPGSQRFCGLSGFSFAWTR